MAFDLFTINGAGGSAKVIRGYAPNTSKVGTSLFRPIVSLIAFTAIYRYTSSLISLSLSSARIILYTRRSGLWYLSTLLILLWASTSTSLILINSCLAGCLNLVPTKLDPASIIIKSGGPRYVLIQYILSAFYIVEAAKSGINLAA
jgi:hypothetical protein